MNRACPVCGIVFEREPGYFLGAMYFSYGLGVACVAPLVALGVALGWPYPAIGIACGVELLLLCPWLFRTSRTLWLHFDQRWDPRP